MKLNSNNLTSKTMSNPLVIVLVLLIILIIVLAIFRSVLPFLNLGFEINAHIGDLKTSFEIEAFNNNDDSDPMLIMYYASWCGHCKRAKPEFQQLMDSYQGNVKVSMIDCEAPENKSISQEQGIKGFPTIRYYPSGLNENYQEYSGGRTYSDFVEYLSSVSGVMNKAPDNGAPVN